MNKIFLCSLQKLIWNRRSRGVVLYLLRFLPIKRTRMMFVSWNGTAYNCNPRAIAEAIINDETCNSFELNYAFLEPNIHKDVPKRIHKTQLGSLEYYYLLATSRFLIVNAIFSGSFFPYKKKGLIYIQAQHGGRGIKKIDFDDAEHLKKEFLQMVDLDQQRTDLMLSDSSFRTKVIRSAFLYKGEILECGLPRNEVFFLDLKEKQRIKEHVLGNLNRPIEAHYLVYAPTFRNNGRTDIYGFDFSRVLSVLNAKFGGSWYILIGSHPNMYGFYKRIYDFSNPNLIDVGQYSNFQEILVVSDILITDYSSAAMDFALQRKPVLSLVKDADSYDRGLYLAPRQLPFPYAEDDDTLCENIRLFDESAYLERLDSFEKKQMGLKETGHASENVVKWIKQQL